VCVSLLRVRTLRHTCPYVSTRCRFARVSGWTVRGTYMYIYTWERVTYVKDVRVCMCARENDGARVGFEKQVLACRVPRGRLDSEAATRWQDPRGTTSAAVWTDLTLALVFPPRIRLLPLTPALALALGLRERTNERTNGCRAQARWLPGCFSSPRQAAPTENQYVGSPVLSPAKSQFLRSTSGRVVLFSILVIPESVRHAPFTSCVNGSWEWLGDRFFAVH